VTAAAMARHGTRSARVLASGAIALLLAACAAGTNGAQSADDAALAARVAAALESASDLPSDAFTVAAEDGVVHIAGSVVCEACGGMQTPSGIQSIQQSLGAVIRAVPGVERVEFDLEYQP